MAWKVEHAPYASPKIEKLLADGYEPFAAVDDEVVLRKMVYDQDGVEDSYEDPWDAQPLPQLIRSNTPSTYDTVTTHLDVARLYGAGFSPSPTDGDNELSERTEVGEANQGSIPSQDGLPPIR